jgi:TolB-like protein/Tfp pilus assembly protein PilF
MHEGREESTAGRSRAPAVSVPSNSVAVLRFLDLSQDRNQAYLADGLGEEILHTLAQSPDLVVIARTSSFAFEPGEADIATIARRLGVAYVLEGSVRRDGDKLRIAAQLIDAATSAHVWSKSYDRHSSDLLSLQREIAADVARALKVTLTVDAANPTPANPEAEDLYLHARYLFHRRGPGDLEAAESNSRRAIEIDPGHARAWTLLAGVLWIREDEEPPGAGTRLEEMGRALERALEIDPMLAEAHARMALYLNRVRGEHAAAEAAFARAVELAPNDPLVLGYRWSRALRDGRLVEATEISRRSVVADPLSGLTRSNAAVVLLAAGQFEQGLAEFYRARELSLGDPRYIIEIGRALLLLGRLDEARSEAETVGEGLDRDQLRVLLESDGAAYARLESDGSPRSLMLLAEIAAFQREDETAFERLATLSTQMLDEWPRDEPLDTLIELRASPFLRSLHDDPRWESLLAELR